MQDWLSLKVLGLGHLQKVKNLGLAELHTALTKAHEELATFTAKVPHWTFPIMFDGPRKEFERLCRVYEGLLAKFSRVKESAVNAFELESRKATMAKDNWRTARDRYRTLFKTSTIPDGLAKKVSDCFYSLAVPPSECGLEISVQCPLVGKQLGTSMVRTC